jgi:hypothetical protein
VSILSLLLKKEINKTKASYLVIIVGLPNCQCLLLDKVTPCACFIKAITPIRPLPQKKNKKKIQ